MVSPVPEGFNSVSVYIIVPNAVEALEFYSAAFGAEPGMRMAGPGGENTTMHAEMRIGNSTVMLSDENPQWGAQSPNTLGGTPGSLHIYCDDVDSLYQQAIDAGCTPEFPLMDAFWGDRMGKVVDPYGHKWGLATHKEDVPPDEMARRGQEWMAQMAQGGECPGGEHA